MKKEKDDVELLAEFLFDLVIEASGEACKSSKVPLWLRIILAVFLGVFYIGLYIIIMFVGIRFMIEQKSIKEMICCGVVLIVITGIYLMTILKFKKELQKRKRDRM